MKRIRFFLALLAVLVILPRPASAQEADSPPEWRGPGRFCGLGPIIDVTGDERIQSLTGGMHSGSFRWSGGFGTLLVRGIAWAAKPPGRALAQRTSKGHILFAERRERGGYTVALWNGDNGAAYFTSPQRLTSAQRAAIDRVDLFNEGEEPKGCTYRTVFSY